MEGQMQQQLPTKNECSVSQVKRLSNDYLEIVKRGNNLADFSKRYIQRVYQGWKSPIRSIENADTAILAMILKLAKAYGATKEVDDTVLNECIEVVLESFSHLGLEEIPIAYRINAAKEEGEQPKGAEMYYGAFTAKNLGRVLADYNKQRKKVIARLSNLEHEEMLAKAKQNRKEKAKAAFQYLKDNFLEIYSEKVNKSKIQSWEDIPEFYFTIAKEKKLLKFEQGEGNQILDEAKQILKIQLQNQISESKDAILIKSLKIKLKQEPDENQAKIIARKLSVWKKIKVDGTGANEVSKNDSSDG